MILVYHVPNNKWNKDSKMGWLSKKDSRQADYELSRKTKSGFTKYEEVEAVFWDMGGSASSLKEPRLRRADVSGRFIYR